MDNEEQLWRNHRFAVTPDDHELSHRAYDLVQQMRETWGGTPPMGATAVIGQSAAMGFIPIQAARQIIAPDPLEMAIHDTSVSIYEVIRLAEERA